MKMEEILKYYENKIKKEAIDATFMEKFTDVQTYFCIKNMYNHLDTLVLCNKEYINCVVSVS